MTPKNLARAVRYRQLALAEPDKDKAAVLYQIADEAERDVLCTVDRIVRVPTGRNCLTWPRCRSGKTKRERGPEPAPFLVTAPAAGDGPPSPRVRPGPLSTVV
jgi:hypothetical protein